MLFPQPNKREDEKKKHLKQVWNQVNVKMKVFMYHFRTIIYSVFGQFFLIPNHFLCLQFFADEASWKAMNDKQLMNLTDFGKILMEKIIQDVSSKRPWNSNENGKFTT